MEKHEAWYKHERKGAHYFFKINPSDVVAIEEQELGAEGLQAPAPERREQQATDSALPQSPRVT